MDLGFIKNCGKHLNFAPLIQKKGKVKTENKFHFFELMVQNLNVFRNFL